MNKLLLEKLRRMGLRVEGPCGLPGEENSVVVAHPLTSPKLAPLVGDHSLIPSGPKHTIVHPRDTTELES